MTCFVAKVCGIYGAACSFLFGFFGFLDTPLDSEDITDDEDRQPELAKVDEESLDTPIRGNVQLTTPCPPNTKRHAMYVGGIFSASVLGITLVQPCRAGGVSVLSERTVFEVCPRPWTGCVLFDTFVPPFKLGPGHLKPRYLHLRLLGHLARIGSSCVQR